MAYTRRRSLHLSISLVFIALTLLLPSLTIASWHKRHSPARLDRAAHTYNAHAATPRRKRQDGQLETSTFGEFFDTASALADSTSNIGETTAQATGNSLGGIGFTVVSEFSTTALPAEATDTASDATATASSAKVTSTTFNEQTESSAASTSESTSSDESSGTDSASSTSVASSSDEAASQTGIGAVQKGFETLSAADVTPIISSIKASSSSAADTSSSPVTTAATATSDSAASAAAAAESSTTSVVATATSNAAGESSTTAESVDPVTSGTSASSTDTAASDATAAQAQSAAVVIPGQKLSVLPIGLGVFGGLAGLAIIVVAYVTYERKKYRTQFRKRKAAENIDRALGVRQSMRAGRV